MKVYELIKLLETRVKNDNNVHNYEVIIPTKDKIRRCPIYYHGMGQTVVGFNHNTKQVLFYPHTKFEDLILEKSKK